jgi:hypothetical protein
MKPSDLVGRDFVATFGCAETERAMRRAVAFLAADGDQWEKPIPRPTTRDEAWEWDHAHPTLWFPGRPIESTIRQECRFHLDYLDVHGVLRQRAIERMAERFGFSAPSIDKQP